MVAAGAVARFKFTLARPHLLPRQIQRQRRFFIPQAAVNCLNGLSVEQPGSDLMKNLIAGLLFLVCVTSHAANPSMAQLNFASNAIVAQISAAQVWTNDDLRVFVAGNANTNTFLLGTNSIDFPEYKAFYLEVNSEKRGYIHHFAGGEQYALEIITEALAGTPTGVEVGSAAFICTATNGGGTNYFILDYGNGISSVQSAASPISYHDGEGSAVYGLCDGGLRFQIGVIGQTFGYFTNQDSTGIAGSAVADYGTIHANSTFNGGYFEVVISDPHFKRLRENAVIVADSIDSGYPILICRTNNGTFKAFEVDGNVTTNATYISSLNGFASYSTLATNAVTPTGWTNTAGVNVSGYITATAVSFTINDRSGAVLYTSPTLTATLPVSLQNGWSLRAASGLVGTILPW